MSTIHPNPHPQAGELVKLADGTLYRLEDWWDRMAGMSWTAANGNPAALQYAVHSATAGLPLDDEVVYGKVNSLGYLRHISEIATPTVDGEHRG